MSKLIWEFRSPRVTDDELLWQVGERSSTSRNLSVSHVRFPVVITAISLLIEKSHQTERDWKTQQSFVASLFAELGIQLAGSIGCSCLEREREREKADWGMRKRCRLEANESDGEPKLAQYNQVTMYSASAERM